MRSLQTLYKKTSTGAIQQWIISVDGNTIITQYGQVGGKQQETRDTILNGKNIGKVNQTTPEKQAELEAEAKWVKQQKRGYVEDINRAKASETDIEGGFSVMLAHSYSKQGAKIKYPAYMQPKLDGIRCAAIIDDGVCTLWTRTRKPILSMPHIVQALEETFPTGVHKIDGELYNHEMKHEFEKLVSLIRQEEPAEGHEIVQYHIYDYVSDAIFGQRTKLISDLVINSNSLIKVETQAVMTENEAIELFSAFCAKGYEGGMIRNSSSLYVGKRSYDLQKIKEFEDAEFNIIGIKEGRGKLTGHVGSFVCVTDKGIPFEAKMMGATEVLQQYFVNHGLWKDKRLTVKYQGITNKNGVPRFPVGVRIREDNT